MGRLEEGIGEFVVKCPNFQQVKAEHLNSGDLLQEIQVTTWKWEDINMGFVVGLPQTQKQYESIWVVVDRLTKSVCFIPVRSTYSAEYYAKILIDEIVCCHGILLSIISDRVAQFKSRFWRLF